MVSYEDLIYHFTDIYLKTAMECSICKENYTMGDDNDFLDDSMRFFVSLLSIVEENDRLDINDLKKTLKSRQQEEISKFQQFIQHKIVEMAIETVDLSDLGEKQEVTVGFYEEKIRTFYKTIIDDEYDEVKDNPAELLKYIRTKEEKCEIRRCKNEADGYSK